MNCQRDAIGSAIVAMGLAKLKALRPVIAEAVKADNPEFVVPWLANLMRKMPVEELAVLCATSICMHEAEVEMNKENEFVKGN